MHRHLYLVAGAIVYMWTTDSGTIAFTDDPKRIPPRYVEQAQAHRLEPIDTYARFTPVVGRDLEPEGE